MTAYTAWGFAAYMSDPDGPVISQYMDYALDQVGVEYAERGVPLPERRFWVIGQAAADCEQVALAVQMVGLGTAGAPIALTQCDGPRSLMFTVQTFRCAPTLDSRGRAPSAEMIQDSGYVVAMDMEIMLYGLPTRFDVYQTGISCSVVATPNEGGIHGAVGTYTVTL